MRQTPSSIRKAAIGLVALLLLLLLLTASAGAESGGAESGAVAAPDASYTLSWWTVDGGGATSVTVGKYTLGGTAGQPDAGALESGAYTLGGGFWGGGAVAIEHLIYLPLVQR